MIRAWEAVLSLVLFYCIFSSSEESVYSKTFVRNNTSRVTDFTIFYTLLSVFYAMHYEPSLILSEYLTACWQVGIYPLANMKNRVFHVLLHCVTKRDDVGIVPDLSSIPICGFVDPGTALRAFPSPLALPREVWSRFGRRENFPAIPEIGNPFFHTLRPTFIFMTLQ